MQGDRLVVTGRSSGSHFPRKQEAINQRYEADGTTSAGPFFIEGSIYGRDMRFHGPGAVLGPVLGRGDITLEPSEGKGPQRFLGGLHTASGNIGCVARTSGYRGSLMASIENTGVVVRGDVIGDQVSLVDAVVFGNVRGRRVRLTRCIVFGNVIAEEGAVIGSSTVIGYDSKGEVRFEGPSSMIFPMGTSVDAPAFVPSIDEAGVELGCSVMFLPALLGQGSPSLVFRPRLDTTGAASDGSWRATAEDLSTGDAGVLGSALHPVDWVRHPVDTTVRKLRGREFVEELFPSERYIISLGGRALDFQAVVPTLHHVTWMLKTAIEYDHYSPVNQTRTEAAWKERCRPDELRLLQWATSKEPPARDPSTKDAPALRRPAGRGTQEA
jgi:hypothetical protein